MTRGEGEAQWAVPRRPSEGPSPWKAVDVHSARATCSNGVPTAATKPFAYVVETGKTFVPTSFAFNGPVLAAKQWPASARSGHLHGDAASRFIGLPSPTRITVEKQLAEGDLVATRWIGRGTHEGELMGIQPTGKQVTVSGLTISRLEGDKIVEEFQNWDTFGTMQQLGAVPEMANA